MSSNFYVWYVVAALVVAITAFIVYYTSYRLYERKMMTSMRRTNNRLSLILNTSKVYIWLFDIAGRTITSINTKGKKSVIRCRYRQR